jgi:hypothetical protein
MDRKVASPVAAMRTISVMVPSSHTTHRSAPTASAIARILFSSVMRGWKSMKRLVAVNIIEHINEYITPVVLPGADEPPEQAPVPAERLEAELCLMAGHLAAATSRFLDLVGEYDASNGWAAWDMRSCAEWLSWRCQIGPGTAREHVRVARALRTLPVTHAEFAAGRMGYSKVREITRIATPATEAGLAEIMTPMTAGQAERFARAYRSCEQDQPGGRREPRTSLRFRSDPDNGEVSVSLYLPPADGAVVLQALRAATGDLDRQDGETPAGAGAGAGQPVPDLTGDGWPAPFLVAVTDLAAALVAICGGYLGGKIAAADNADIYQVHIHTTAEALTPRRSSRNAAAVRRSRNAGPAGRAPGAPGPVPPRRRPRDQPPARAADRLLRHPLPDRARHWTFTDPGTGRTLTPARPHNTSRRDAGTGALESMTASGGHHHNGYGVRPTAPAGCSRPGSLQIAVMRLDQLAAGGRAELGVQLAYVGLHGVARDQ